MISLARYAYYEHNRSDTYGLLGISPSVVLRLLDFNCHAQKIQLALALEFSARAWATARPPPKAWH
ncbi:protein of unknown function [Methylorubrum extorquens]|uniref:Uncharacterized protein n=1 Tax=Methylorubrum extorquens TaxID=408 RepID=A0A2N9ALK0_METEX|nr:protein of unknown function [Methylorubrum extorquens]